MTGALLALWATTLLSQEELVTDEADLSCSTSNSDVWRESGAWFSERSYYMRSTCRQREPGARSSESPIPLLNQRCPKRRRLALPSPLLWYSDSHLRCELLGKEDTVAGRDAALHKYTLSMP